MAEHPITPPPELVQQWSEQASYYGNTSAAIETITTQAVRWGANQELEACCEWLTTTAMTKPWETVAQLANELRAARRPRPQSLKGQALEELGKISISPELGITYSALETIRRALEQLDD